MNKIEKIFVPTDFSPCSQEAIAYAFFLAGQLNATILLTHILEPIRYPIDFAMIESADDDQMKTVQALDRISRSWRQRGARIETHLFKGNPATEIVQKSKDLECDLIVMGTHARTGMAYLRMGSVAERVVRTASLPVLTVRQKMGKGCEKLSQEEPIEASAFSERPSR